MTVGGKTRSVGEVSAEEAFRLLGADPRAVLVDVRTQPEWAFVGVPDLGQLGKRALLKEWQAYPTMRVDPGFPEALAREVTAAGGALDAPLLFLCRSGSRSLAAAHAMADAGFSACLNVAGGFEGPPDEKRHRGRVEGWKASGLPWTQS